MSEIRTYQIEVKRIEEIVIDPVLTCADLDNLCSKITELLIDKFTKISTMLSPCNVCVVGEHLIINDNLGVVKDLAEVLQAFGFVVDTIDGSPIGLKGRIYAITDAVFELNRVLQGEIGLQGITDEIIKTDKKLSQVIANCTKNGTIHLSQSKILSSLQNNQMVREIISAVRTGTKITNEMTENIEVTDGDYGYSERSLGMRGSRQKEYSSVVRLINDAILEQNQKARKEVVDGTKSLITCRARQMGYAVHEKKNGNQIELVLVRLN